MKKLLLDAFCGAGGATKGYQRAGFYVVGVDISPQPNYCGDEFHQDDAIDFIKNNGHEFDTIHTSPPCQSFTAYRRKGHGVGDGYPNLIPRTRELLQTIGLPYVIENVEQARHHLINPTKLCGSQFGLDVQRHRMFESNVPLRSQGCDHSQWTPRFPPATNRTNLRKTVEVGVYRIPLPVQKRAMGIDWMNLSELSQAIPPAYIEYIGKFLMAHLLWGERG